MAWLVTFKDSVIGDLRWFGRTDGRLLLDEAEKRILVDPLVDSRNMKALRPNPITQRELRLFGKYRVLFNVDEGRREVNVVLVGEKRGNSLFVRGEEFTQHHESRSPE